MIDNKWNTLLLPDPVDSGVAERQFKRPVSAEQRLMLAVLENAIEHFQEYALASDPRGKALSAEAEEWILEKNSDWFFSFENICETLGLSPAYLRQGLLFWKEKKCRECNLRLRPAATARHPQKRPVSLQRAYRS